MPKGKKIYEDLSKRYFTKNEQRKKRALEKAQNSEDNPNAPAKINNFYVNKPKFARSLNIYNSVQSKRNISPNDIPQNTIAVLL